MAELTISLREVLDDMTSLQANGEPKPFSIRVVSYDSSKQKGGQIVEYPKAIVPRGTMKNHLPSSRLSSVDSFEVKNKKDPQHFEHGTRNIEELLGDSATGRIRKIHIFLILMYNGMKVLL